MVPSWSFSGATPHPCPTATCIARLAAAMALPPPLTWPGSATSGDGEASGCRIRNRHGPDPWSGRRRRSRTGTDGGGRSTFLIPGSSPSLTISSFAASYPWICLSCRLLSCIRRRSPSRTTTTHHRHGSFLPVAGFSSSWIG